MLYVAWKSEFLENLHVLSCFVQLKSLLFIFCVFWIFGNIIKFSLYVDWTDNYGSLQMLLDEYIFGVDAMDDRQIF